MAGGKIHTTSIERTIHKQADITLSVTIVYGFGFYWYADYAEAPNLRPNFTLTSDAFGNYLHYGFEVWTGAVWQFEEIGVHTVLPSPVPGTFADASNWHAVSYTITGQWNDTADLVLCMSGATEVERLKPGSGRQVTLSAGSTTITYYNVVPATGDLTNPYQSIDYALAATVTCYSDQRHGAQTPGSSNATAYNTSGPLLAAGASAVYDLRFVSGAGLTSPPSLPLSSSYGAGNWGSVSTGAPGRAKRRTGSVVSNGGSRQDVRFRGEINKITDPNDEPVSVELSIGSIAHTLTGVLDTFDHTLYIGGYKADGTWTETGSSNQTDTANNYGSDGAGTFGILQTRARFPSPSQAAMGVRYTVPRDALEIEQAAETVLEGYGGTDFAVGSGDDLWNGAPNATVSVVGSGASQVLRFTATGSPATVTKLYNAALDGNPPNERRFGYRYLVVKIRSVGSANQTVRFRVIGSMTRDLVTDADGVWVEHTLDFFDDNLGSSFSIGARPYMEGQGYSIFNIPNGVTIEIEYIKGIRQHDSLFSSLANAQSTRQVTGYTDGLLSLDPNLSVQNEMGEVVDLMTQQPWLGWSGTVLNPWSAPTAASDGDYYVPISELPDDEFPTIELQGRGILHDGTMFLDQDATSPLTVQATVTWLIYTRVPGSGDWLNGGTWDTEVSALWQAVIGLQVVGVLVPGSGQMKLNEKVSGSDRGSGSPEPSGWYATGTPYVKTRPNASAPVVQAHPTATSRYYTIGGAFFLATNPHEFTPTDSFNGLRYYLRWHVVPLAGGVSVDTSPTGRTTTAQVSSDGNIHLSHSANWDTTAWDDVDTGIEGESPCIRYEWGGHRLWLSYLDGAAVKRVYSDDGGGSWSMAVTIASGASQQAFAVAPTGWQLHIWRDGSAIKARAYDAFGTALWAAVTAVASAVEDAGIGVTWDESAQRWYLLYRNTSGNVVTMASADGGKTWS